MSELSDGDLQQEDDKLHPVWGIGSVSSRFPRMVVLVVMLAVLSTSHFMTPSHHPWAHDFLFKVTYLPIVLAGLWFGWRGGLLLALVTGMVYIIHIRLQLTGHHDHGQGGLLLELALYIIIGVIVGWLADGQRRVARALIAANNQLKRSLTALREKTEALLAAEESLRRADRLRAAGEVAAGLAHEVRNPLGGITGAAEIVLNPQTTDADRAEFAGVLKKEITRLDRVITQFLDFARAGGTTEGTANVHEEISFVEKLTAGPRSKKNAEFDRSQVPANLRVQMSSDALRQVLLNLALNALAALHHSGGRIVWTATCENARVTMRIADNGTGVSEGIRERLFEPFVTTRDGTGLGLAIVARLVNEVGGDISLAETSDKGTTFTVCLPHVDASRPA